MQLHYLEVSKTARYAVLGELSTHTRHVWFVCHGYGQLAAPFIEYFHPLDDGYNYIVAPEALARFYTKRMEGRVGATWMTKEDRQTDITDYVRYLDQLYGEVFSRIPRSQVKVHVLGFSQGAATVSRWIAEGTVELDTWVLWGGLFPHDLNFAVNPEKLKGASTFLVYGDEDPFRDEEKLKERHQLVAEAGLHYQQVEFRGGHEIPEAALRSLIEQYPDTFQ